MIFCFSTKNDLYSQSNSADCQDEINISLGAECNSAIPWEGINSWKPSCMLIKDTNGNTVAAVSGDGNIIDTDEVDCAMPIDSMWFDTLQRVKVRIHQIPGWTRNCDQLLNPDTVWIRESQMPGPLSEDLGCNRDTFWVPGGVIIGGAVSPINSVTVIKLGDNKDIPYCPLHTPIENRTDGFFQFRDTVIEYSIEIFNKTIYRVDTFSHTDPLIWVKGTQIVNNNGILDTVHNYIHTPPNGGFINIGPELCKYPEIFKVDVTHIDGTAKLKPGHYNYNSYNIDSSNYCWGDLNIEYKILPVLDGRKDTISCIDLSDYSRAESYTYNSNTAKELKEECQWAEELVRGGPANNPLTALRTVDYVSDAVNSKIRHCFTHTITHNDEYQRDFESLCDTVVKIRTFYADHLIHGNISINELAQDTLIVTPIHFDSIKFPDTLFALKCGILANQDYPPEDIAEYLYHAYKHFNYQDRNVVLDYNPATAEYAEGSPCITFADQYKSQEHSKYLQWNKVFQYSDYNNWGVRKAFPFINRHSKTIDKKLKEKLVSAGADQTNDTDLWTLNEVSVPISLTICNIIASYSDVHKIEGCSGELTIYRTWHLLDWCTAQSKEHTQIIKIIDNQPPQILSLNGKSLSLDGHFSDDFYFGRYIQNDQIENDDLKDDTISHNENVKVEVPGYGLLGVHWINISEPWGCIATYTFPAPDLVDHCSESSFVYELLDDNWNSNGKTYTSGESENINWIDNESLTHPIVKLRAWDECGNELEYFYYLKAIDKFPPAVVLYDSLVVTLTYEKGANGTAKVRCIDVNAGSHDGDCGDIKCHIRTSDNEVWGDSLHFSCDDIGHVEVQVRITD